MFEKTENKRKNETGVGPIFLKKTCMLGVNDLNMKVCATSLLPENISMTVSDLKIGIFGHCPFVWYSNQQPSKFQDEWNSNIPGGTDENEDQGPIRQN